MRISVRDANWLSYDHLRVVGPFRDVDAAGVRQTLVAFHRRYPNHPLFSRVNRARRRWERMTPSDFAAMVDRTVVEFVNQRSDEPGPSSADPAESMRANLLATPLEDVPMRLVVADGYVGIRMTHAIGDGRVFNAVLPEIIAATAARREPRLPEARPTRLPLLRASLRFFGSSPGNVRRLLRVERPVLPGPVEPTRHWDPGTCSFYAHSDSGLVDGVRRWRDQSAPGVSATSLLFAATWAAFGEAGMNPDDSGIMILVDARRYLAKGALVDGNFTAAQYVRPRVPGNPRAIQDAMDAAIDAGRPLSTLALEDARLLRGGHGDRAPRRVSQTPRPQLTLTHVGRLPMYAALPWRTTERVMISAPTPGGPEGVTISFAEVDGAIHINVSFHSSTFPEAQIRQIAAQICTDPLGLVERATARAEATQTAQLAR